MAAADTQEVLLSGPAPRRAWVGVQLLCSLALVLGLLTVWADTAAGVTRVTFRTILSNDNDFITGVVDIGGLLTRSTASTLPSATAFTWGASGAGTDCANLLTGLSIPLQTMTPGNYCVAKIIAANDNIHPAYPLMATPRAARPNSLDAWLRMRLVRRTPTGSLSVEGMNNRLRLYMHEYASGSSRTAAAYQTADCTSTNYQPTASLGSPAGTAKSTATIADISSTVNGSRTALTTLGPSGMNVGKHPGVAIPADSTVTALANSGLGLVNGTNANPTEANMVTDPASASYNAFNLIGNDEITNTRLLTNSNTPNGTRPGGHLVESRMLKQTFRYFCTAIFFPNDTTNLTAGNSAGDNAAQGASVTYHVVLSAAQQANRSVS